MTEKMSLDVVTSRGMNLKDGTLTNRGLKVINFHNGSLYHTITYNNGLCHEVRLNNRLCEPWNEDPKE